MGKNKQNITNTNPTGVPDLENLFLDSALPNLHSQLSREIYFSLRPIPAYISNLDIDSQLFETQLSEKPKTFSERNLAEITRENMDMVLNKYISGRFSIDRANSRKVIKNLFQTEGIKVYLGGSLVERPEKTYHNDIDILVLGNSNTITKAASDLKNLEGKTMGLPSVAAKLDEDYFYTLYMNLNVDNRFKLRPKLLVSSILNIYGGNVGKPIDISFATYDALGYPEKE